jgi:uncharacterized protein (TIGR02246 family)
MNRIVIAILAAALLGSPGGASAEESARSADEEAIRSSVRERIESFNRHAASGSAGFTPDADFVNVFGAWTRGPAEIEKFRKERMETVLREAQITMLDLRIRFVRPDVAVVHELDEMSGVLGADGKKLPPHRELSLRVMVKEQGKWLTTAVHNTVVRPRGM